MGNNRNAEHYKDNTAGEAIKKADAQPDRVTEYIKLVKRLSELCGMKVANRIHIEYQGKIYK